MKSILLSVCPPATAYLGSAYPILLQSLRLPDVLSSTDCSKLGAAWILGSVGLVILTFILTRRYERRQRASGSSATQRQRMPRQQEVQYSDRLPSEDSRHLASIYQELIQANQDIEIFLYKAYHNFLGPIATIRGICNVAAMESREASSLDYFEKVSTVADNMQEMLAQLLEISVIHDRELVIEPTDLLTFLDGVQADLLVNTPYDTVRMHYQFPTTQLEVDSFLLQQTIIKIISNTSSFRRPDAKRQLELAVAYQEEGEDHYLIMRDDHLSIPDEIASDIFRMFYRGTPRADDHGLGLYTARYALRRMGGDISVASRGYSTTFRLRLPRRTNQQYQHFLETLADHA